MQDKDTDWALERLLAEAPKPMPPAALYGRILADMNGPRPLGWRGALQVLWPFGPAWQPATAFVLMAFAGFLLSPTLNPAAQDGVPYELADASFSTLVLGGDDIYGAYP